MVAKMEEEMHRMMCTFLAVLFSTRNRSTTLNFIHLVMQVFTVCVLLCMLRLCKHHGEEDTSKDSLAYLSLHSKRLWVRSTKLGRPLRGSP